MMLPEHKINIQNPRLYILASNENENLKKEAT